MGCYHPITVLNKKTGFGTLPAPCGGCEGCRKQRAADWSFRLLEEMKNHQLSLFATLTYSDENVRASPSGVLSLNKKDLQNFFKRLRKRSYSKIKYYACGEYGSRTFRPHYHAIIFGATANAVANAWEAGHSDFGEVNIKTIQYVTGYIIKPKTVGFNPDDDRQREFSHMSRGLGLSHLTPEMIEYYEKTGNSFVVVDQAKQRLPRYYRDKIFTEAERDAINAKAQIKQEKILDKKLREYSGDFTAMERDRVSNIEAQKENFLSQKNTTRKKI